MQAKTRLVPTPHFRILAGLASVSLLLAAGASSTAFADLAVSANDNKLVLVNGVPTVVAVHGPTPSPSSTLARNHRGY